MKILFTNFVFLFLVIGTFSQANSSANTEFLDLLNGAKTISLHPSLQSYLNDLVASGLLNKEELDELIEDTKVSGQTSNKIEVSVKGNKIYFGKFYLAQAPNSSIITPDGTVLRYVKTKSFFQNLKAISDSVSGKKVTWKSILIPKAFASEAKSAEQLAAALAFTGKSFFSMAQAAAVTLCGIPAIPIDFLRYKFAQSLFHGKVLCENGRYVKYNYPDYLTLMSIDFAEKPSTQIGFEPVEAFARAACAAPLARSGVIAEYSSRPANYYDAKGTIGKKENASLEELTRAFGNKVPTCDSSMSGKLKAYFDQKIVETQRRIAQHHEKRQNAAPAAAPVK